MRAPGTRRSSARSTHHELRLGRELLLRLGTALPLLFERAQLLAQLRHAAVALHPALRASSIAGADGGADLLRERAHRSGLARRGGCKQRRDLQPHLRGCPP